MKDILISIGVVRGVPVVMNNCFLRECFFFHQNVVNCNFDFTPLCMKSCSFVLSLVKYSFRINVVLLVCYHGIYEYKLFKRYAFFFIDVQKFIISLFIFYIESITFPFQ